MCLCFVYFFNELFNGLHLYKLLDGLEHTSLFEIPLIYAKLGIPVDSISIAHKNPIIALNINDINKYFGVEHKLDTLQNISPKIIIGNRINVVMF